MQSAQGDAGHVTTVIYPSARVLTIGYSGGQATSVSLDGNVLIDQIQYQPFGPVSGWTWHMASGTIHGQVLPELRQHGHATEVPAAREIHVAALAIELAPVLADDADGQQLAVQQVGELGVHEQAHGSAHAAAHAGAPQSEHAGRHAAAPQASLQTPRGSSTALSTKTAEQSRRSLIASSRTRAR